MQYIKLETIIPEAFSGQRLDQTLAQLFPQYSRARLQQWIKAHQVTVDGKFPKTIRDKVLAGQKINIEGILEPQALWEPQAIPLNLIYEDEALLVVNKPAGLVVHPAHGNPHSTLVNALLNYDASLSLIPRAGIVHRLDKDTSGLLVVARTLEAHTDLVKQLQARRVKREYEAVVKGIVISGGTVDAPIGRHPKQRTHMAVIDSGKTAMTHYRVLERYHAHTHLKVNLETGRTHQIRVHMAYIHHPIVGDQTYGGRLQIPAQCSESLKQCLQTFKRQALHARRIELQHPITKAWLSWEAPLPEDMENLLQHLRADAQIK